jgi:hypothetical protein
MVPYKNHTTLGNSCSCAEVIDVFSWSEALILMEILNGGRRRRSQLKTHADSWAAVCCGRAERRIRAYRRLFTDD